MEQVDQSGDRPWDAKKTIKCSCGETFETEDAGKEHIREKAQGVTPDQYRQIAEEARGTVLYGFECLGLCAHTYSTRWSHETLDLTVFATPDHEETNGIVVQVRADADAVEVMNDTIPVEDVTELTPTKYIDALDEWLLDNLVTDSSGGDSSE